MAKGAQLVKRSNCLNHFPPLHDAPDGRKRGEVSYTPEARPKGRWMFG